MQGGKRTLLTVQCISFLLPSLQAYALEESIIVLEDDDSHLLVDISLCLSGQASYPWLRERNTVVVAVGYLEVTDMILEDVSTLYMS